MRDKYSESYGYILGIESVVWEVPVVKYICEIKNKNLKNVVWTCEVSLAQTWGFVGEESIVSKHVLSHLQLYQNFIEDGELVAYKIREVIEIVEE